MPFNRRPDSHPEFILLGVNNREEGGVTIKAGRNFTDGEYFADWVFPMNEIEGGGED